MLCGGMIAIHPLFSNSGRNKKQECIVVLRHKTPERPAGIIIDANVCARSPAIFGENVNCNFQPAACVTIGQFR